MHLLRYSIPFIQNFHEKSAHKNERLFRYAHKIFYKGSIFILIHNTIITHIVLCVNSFFENTQDIVIKKLKKVLTNTHKRRIIYNARRRNNETPRFNQTIRK